MQKSFKVSAILCHHRGLLIDNAIDSLAKSFNVDLEIIVATSCPESEKRLRDKYPGIKVFLCDGGPARKRNIATRFATHDFIAFFDDDIEVTPNSVYYMARLLHLPEVGMVYGKLLNMEHRTQFDEAGSFLTWSGFLYARCESGLLDTGQFEENCNILAGKSAACIVKRSIFWKAKGFDESYEILGEETDLSWRIWLLGYKVMYCPKSVTYHAFNTRFKPADFYIPRRVYFNGCRNYISMLLTNLGIAQLPVPIITQTLVWGMAGMGMILTGKFEAGVNIFKGLFYVISHLDIILKKRKSVQTTRTISDRDLLPIITHNPSLGYYVKRFIHYIRTGRHG